RALYRCSGSANQRPVEHLVYYNGTKVTSGQRWSDILGPHGFGRRNIEYSGHFIGQSADLLDPELDHVAGLEEFAAARPDAGRRAGEGEGAGGGRHGVGHT